MENHQWITITFLNITLLILLCGSGSADQEFEVEPSPITVERGASVTFPCKVRNLQGKIQWTMDGFGLGTDRELVSYTRYTMIGSNETGNYSLHISAALLADEADYQCQVSATENEPLLTLRSKIAKLTVLYPPKDDEDQVFIDLDSPLQTIAGTKVRISCRGGLTKPVSKITWYKGDNKITKGVEESIESLPNSLLSSITSWIDLTPDKSYHRENISCHISHEALDEPIVRSLMMIVQYPPEVSIAKHFHKAKEGDDVKFTCSAEGNPPNFRFLWELNGVTVTGDHETELVLKNIDRTKNGAKVKCIVSNTVGNGRATEELIVQYAPVFKEDPKDVDADEGERVTLKCLVDSNPKAEVIWTHDLSQKVIGHGAEWSFEVTKETTGLYRCRVAAPGYQEITRTLRVFMRGAPVVLPDQTSYGIEGDISQVECSIRSIPRPVEVVWSKDGTTIDAKNSPNYDQTEVKTREGVRNTLIIYETKSIDFTNYNCTAKNGYGSKTQSIELRRQQGLPLVTTLVAIIGGIVFLVIVAILIILFNKRGSAYKDSNGSSIEKQSVRSSDRSSTHDSGLKTESRTATGSEVSPTDDEDDYSHDEWDSSEVITRRNLNRIPLDPYNRNSGDYNESDFPLKAPPGGSGGGYIPYVDYSRDYNPPPPAPSANYNRNSFYSGQPLNNVDPRFSAAYGNPYLRVPPGARSAQSAQYGSTGVLPPAGGTMTSPLLGNSLGDQSPLATSQNNNLNNISANNKNVYNQIAHNNIRNNPNSQYVILPQSETSIPQGAHI